MHEPQADHPLLVGTLLIENLSIDLLFFIKEQVEEIQMNNAVAIICSKMQISTQMFQ